MQIHNRLLTQSHRAPPRICREGAEIRRTTIAGTEAVLDRSERPRSRHLFRSKRALMPQSSTASPDISCSSWEPHGGSTITGGDAALREMKTGRGSLQQSRIQKTHACLSFHPASHDVARRWTALTRPPVVEGTLLDWEAAEGPRHIHIPSSSALPASTKANFKPRNGPACSNAPITHPPK